MNDPGWRVKRVWRLYKHGHSYVLAEKGKIPSYVELKPCQECGHPHYRAVQFKLIGEWTGQLTEETGRWLAGAIKAGYKGKARSP